MYIKTIKTSKITTNDSLEKVLDLYIRQVSEEDIIAITSKILSILQGRIVPKDSISKHLLIKQEADLILEASNPYGMYLTIKNGILIPSAGIDESNADNYYILYPQNIQETASRIWRYLRKRHNVKKLGILITDSHTTIMRRGVVGIALGWCGFKPLYSYVGKLDIYGRPLKVTQANILDSLAATAVFTMGEGDERTPIALIKEAPRITFDDHPPTKEDEDSITISMDEDLYGPLLKAPEWSKTT